MDAYQEMVDEEHEKSKYYLENALKILGIAQISASVADVFWGGGINLSLFNVLIFITGMIFMVGSDLMKKPLKKIQKEEEREVENRLRFEPEKVYDTFTEQLYHAYENEERRIDDKRFDFLKKEKEKNEDPGNL